MPRIRRYNAKKKLALARKLIGEIDDRMENLGRLIETAKTRKEADAIFSLMDNSAHMVDRQKSSIWDYLVNWEKVPWE